MGLVIASPFCLVCVPELSVVCVETRHMQALLKAQRVSPVRLSAILNRYCMRQRDDLPLQNK